MNFTEDDLRKLGYEKQANGRWAKPGISAPSDSRQPTQHQPVSKRQTKPKAKASADKTAKETSQGAGRYRLIITTYTNQPRDCDNVIPKWHLDAIVKAGLVPDDSCVYIPEATQRVRLCRGKPYTVLEVIREA